MLIMYYYCYNRVFVLFSRRLTTTGKRCLRNFDGGTVRGSHALHETRVLTFEFADYTDFLKHVTAAGGY